jgi:hypothetical protein
MLLRNGFGLLPFNTQNPANVPEEVADRTWSTHTILLVHDLLGQSAIFAVVALLITSV